MSQTCEVYEYIADGALTWTTDCDHATSLLLALTSGHMGELVRAGMGVDEESGAGGDGDGAEGGAGCGHRCQQNGAAGRGASKDTVNTGMGGM